MHPISHASQTNPSCGLQRHSRWHRHRQDAGMTLEGYDTASMLLCQRQYEQQLDSPSQRRHQPADEKTPCPSCGLQRRSI